MKVCTTCGSEWPDDTKFCPNDGTTLRSEQSTDLVGSVIADRYHIEKKLGEGGMGAVYLGEHVKMGRKSAIKVMTQAMANDPEAIARFNREAANAARINHPNVCAIYDFGETRDGVIYLAMEFIQGESLNDLLKREGALPPKRAAQILQQTGHALQAAHDLGIVHRDLKPDNIMLAKGRDRTDVVKVVDFGIAKAMGGEEGQKVTKTGLVVGTPEYMSPEQLSGDVLDGRSDIYSLALVFFRMLTGTLPFQADTAQETMIKRLTDEPLKLSDALPGAQFPPKLQEVMDHALQRMPSERYDSAARFADDVAQAVASMRAASVGADDATQLISAEEVGATAALAKTRVAGRSAPPTPTTPQPQPSAKAPPAKKKPIVAIAASVAVLAVGGVGAAVMLKGGDGVPQEPGTGSPVIEDTAQNQTASDVNRSSQTPSNPVVNGSRQPVNRPTPRETTRTVAVPGPTAPVETLDVDAADERLLAAIDSLADPQARVRQRVFAQGIYDRADAPPFLRETAASIIAAAYSQEDRRAEACTWFGLAQQLATRAGKYDAQKRAIGCN